MSIEKIQLGDTLSQSENIVETNIDKLKALFPEIVTEGKIDFKVLQEVLGNELEEGEEYYRFTWAGKANARREAQKPSTGTLRPAPEESVDWDTTENLYIEGDNLEVLKLLQKGYAGKVKMIYIDPPYNTGKDFVYKDNYKDNLRNYQGITGQLDDDGNKLSTNSDSDGRFHSNWLNMIYPRLRLARNLMADDGLIFMSIDDNEVDNARRVLNEVFGESNFIDCIIWKKRYGGGAKEKYLISLHEYVLVFAKDESKLNNFSIPLTEESIKRYYKSKDANFSKRGPYRTHPLEATKSMGERKNLVFPISAPNGKEINPKRQWLWGKDRVREALDNGELEFLKNKNDEWSVHTKQYLYGSDGEMRTGKPFSIIDNVFTQHGTNEIIDLFGNAQIFSFPKPTQLIQFLVNVALDDKNGLILDFFSGSSSSAHGIMQLNSKDSGKRKFIQVQLPEIIDEKGEAYKSGYRNIAQIGIDRIKRAAKKIKEENPETAKNLDLGFKVFKLDTSNIKGWDGNPKSFNESLFDAQDNIKTDRTEHDVLYEILLKYGLDLTLPIEEKQIAGKTVFSVGYGALFICLADNIGSNVAEGIGAWKEELQPEVCRVVFKDSGFTDVHKTNSVQTLKRFGITEIKSI